MFLSIIVINRKRFQHLGKTAKQDSTTCDGCFGNLIFFCRSAILPGRIFVPWKMIVFPFSQHKVLMTQKKTSDARKKSMHQKSGNLIQACTTKL